MSANSPTPVLYAQKHVKFDITEVIKTPHHWAFVVGSAGAPCVGNLTIIDSDNGLSPGPTWTLGTNFSEILSEIHSFSFSKMHLKMSSAKWRLFGLGLNELKLGLKHM